MTSWVYVCDIDRFRGLWCDVQFFSSAACQKYNVRSLVFTSTVNVVFGGQRIEGGDENLPYFDSNQVGAWSILFGILGFSYGSNC